MSILVPFNGSNFIIPTPNEIGWGTNLDNYLVAIANGCLQNIGGSFTLSNDADFGGTNGLKAVYYKTRSANIAGSGQFRLANAVDSINWRDFGNTTDLPLTVNASNQLTFNGIPLAGAGVLTPNRAVISDGSGNVTSSSVTSTELGYVSGVTSALQTQINSKLNLSGGTLTGDLTFASNKGIFFTDNTSNTIKITAPTAAISYTLKWPAAQGAINQYLTNDGSGNLSWTNAAGTGTVNSGTQYQLGYYASSSNVISGNTSITTSATGQLLVNTVSSTYKLHTKGGNDFTIAADNDGSQYTTLSFLNNGTDKVDLYWDNTNSKFFIQPTAGTIILTKNTVPGIDNTQSLGSASFRWSDIYVNTLHLNSLSSPLSVSNGGTGASSFTANTFLYGNSTSPIQVATNFTFTSSGKVSLLAVSNDSSTVNLSNGSGAISFDKYSSGFIGTVNGLNAADQSSIVTGNALLISAGHTSGSAAENTLSLGINNVEKVHIDDVTGVQVIPDLYTVAWTDYSGTSTITGWSSFTVKQLNYKKIGKLVFIAYRLDGTSNSVNTSFTLPFAVDTVAIPEVNVGRAVNNGTRVDTAIAQSSSSTTTFFRDSDGTSWTNTGTKTVWGQFWYETV